MQAVKEGAGGGAVAEALRLIPFLLAPPAGKWERHPWVVMPGDEARYLLSGFA